MIEAQNRLEFELTIDTLSHSLMGKLRDVSCEFNTFNLTQYGQNFADDTFKCIFLNENARISIKFH